MPLALLNLIIPALIPAAADGLRGVFAWLTGSRGAQPQNVDEIIKLQQADTEHLRALAELDKPSGEISKWVADLRASFRYIAAGIIVVLECALVVGVMYDPTLDEMTTAFTNNIFAPVWSFIFGERMYSHMKNGK